VPNVTDEVRELEILETVADDPEVRQVDIAAQLGVAVGTVNWVLKRLVAKGYVKARRIGRWQWKYLLTPQGVARKALLTRDYVRYSMALYREIRQQAVTAIDEISRAGHDTVILNAPAENEIADILRLSCIERGLEVLYADSTDGVPKIVVDGRQTAVVWPEEVGKK